MMEQSFDNIPEPIKAAVLQLEPLLKRSESDPRPVALMVCGMAGKLHLNRVYALYRNVVYASTQALGKVLSLKQYSVDHRRSNGSHSMALSLLTTDYME